jgi:hypothetical protein
MRQLHDRPLEAAVNGPTKRETAGRLIRRVWTAAQISFVIATSPGGRGLINQTPMVQKTLQPEVRREVRLDAAGAPIHEEPLSAQVSDLGEHHAREDERRRDRAVQAATRARRPRSEEHRRPEGAKQLEQSRTQDRSIERER